MSISKQTEEILEKEYYYQKAIELDIANYSAIAKNIQNKTGGNLDAVKVAVMRWADKHKKSPQYIANIKEILKKSSVNLESNVNAYIFRKNIDTEKLDGEKVISKDFVLLITKQKNSIKNTIMKHENIYNLKIESPPEIENVIGVIEFVLNKLATVGINVLEFYSCYTTTNFIVSKKDAVTAFKIIEEMTS